MIYTKSELINIHKIELEILCEVQNICNEAGIEFFLAGGTALGAIRHGGFIPWDDDIDIGMTRDNYNKFIEIAPQKLSDKYFLQSINTEAGTPYLYCKVRENTGTVFIEYCNRNLNIHKGVYIDIFPFDEVPDDDNLGNEQFNKVMKYVRYFTFRNTPDISQPPLTIKDKCKFVLRRFMHYIFMLVPRKYINNKLEKEMTKYNGTNQKNMDCLFFPIRKGDYMAKTDMFPLTHKLFEGIEMPMLNHWDVYLKTHYGNYMEYPPEEKRFGHKPYKIVI